MAVIKENYFQINSIVKLFKVLETLVGRDEWELAALTEKVDIPKPTVLRMLLTLKSLGYVDQTAVGKRYYATTKMFDVGSKAIPKIDVVKISQPIMTRLAEECDETVYLSVLSGIESIVVAKISSNHYLKVDAYIGDRIKGYQSSSGKALLATMTADERAVLFADHEFEQKTRKGISSLDELETDLSKVKQRGYALIDEELYQGIRSVAVPVFNHRHDAIAALAVVVPSVRLSLKGIPKFAKSVVEAGKAISKKMGSTLCEKEGG